MSEKLHRIALKGAPGLREATPLADQLRDALTRYSEILVTTKDLEAVDISILQLLISARRTAVAAGKSLTLQVPRDGVLRQALVKAGFLAADGTPLTPDGDFWTGTPA